MKTPFVSPEDARVLHQRLDSKMTPDMPAQIGNVLTFADKKTDKYGSDKFLFHARGFATVVKDGIPYSIIFASEPSNEQICAFACYIVAGHHEKGIIWNLRDNKEYEITVPDRQAFLDQTAITATKGYLTEFREYRRKEPTKTIEQRLGY